MTVISILFHIGYAILVLLNGNREALVMNEKRFDLPTNIKQIGSIGEGLKIYMEDYVSTYLRQYAESGGHGERVAFLVGKNMVIDGQPYIFINGAIQGKHSEFVDNMEIFTDRSFDYAEGQLAKYFPGGEIVGWMQSQPGYGVHLNPAYADYHMNNFTSPHQVLFVCDYNDKQTIFYAWNEDMTAMGELDGYFVYYDQNKGMQDYMAANKITRLRERDETSPDKSAVMKIFGDEEKEKTAPFVSRLARGARDMQRGARKTKTKPMNTVKTTEPSRVDEYRKTSNLLIGLCAVLFVVSFIMGAGLIQSDGRIARLEDRILVLDSTAAVLNDQLRQLAAMPVFAQGNYVPQAAAPATTPPYQPQTPTPTPQAGRPGRCGRCRPAPPTSRLSPRTGLGCRGR